MGSLSQTVAYKQCCQELRVQHRLRLSAMSTAAACILKPRDKPYTAAMQFE